MKELWRGAAAIALVAGALTGCASPHYPIRPGEAAGPPPLTMPQPRYPISRSAPAAAPPQAAAAPAPPAPIAAPIAPVQSQPRPPADAPASATAAASPASATESAQPPAPTPIAAARPALAAPAPATPASSTPGPAAGSAPATPAAWAPTARTLAHDLPPAPVRWSPYQPTPRAAPVRRYETSYAAAGEVVPASGIFENYEVRRGDHVDALARAFRTTRRVLLDANRRLHPPYRIQPGEILEVPVARAYVARAGDTLAEVGRRFGVEAGELAQLNHVSERRPLRGGERIGLPSSMHDRGPLRIQRLERVEYAEAAPRRAWSAPSPAYVRPAQTALPAPGPESRPAAPLQAPGAAYATPPPTRAIPQAAPVLTDAQISEATKGRFVWPVHGAIAAAFGPSGLGERNDGIDIEAARDTSVRAAAAGQVVYAGDQVKGGFGNLVLIEHADGWFTAYAHLDKITVHMMDHVAQGQEVGVVGMTGDAKEPELHFEIRYHPAPGVKTQPIDPVLALPPT